MSKGKRFDTSAVDDDRPTFQATLRTLFLVLPLLLAQTPAAQAQVSVGIGIEVPGVSIGINLPTFPDLQRVPGYPVYYAADAGGNYFYYDGLYWVFQGNDWYASSWYNGPWRRVMPLYVPAYVLRVPVHYYRQPPPYFRPWRADAPPRWDQHWGHEWQQRRPGWNQWDRHAAPAPAPLPTYQRRYPQSRYPQEQDRQQKIRAENFDYKPREPVSRQAYQWPDRSPPHQQGRPGQWAEPRPASAEPPKARPSPQPRPPAHAQHPSREQDRPRVAQPSHEPPPKAAPQYRGDPQGRADPSNPKRKRRLTTLGPAVRRSNSSSDRRSGLSHGPRRRKRPGATECTAIATDAGPIASRTVIARTAPRGRAAGPRPPSGSCSGARPTTGQRLSRDAGLNPTARRRQRRRWPPQCRRSAR